MIDLIWVSGHCNPNAALLTVLGGAWAVHLIGGGVISWLQKRTWHRISCYLMCHAQCRGRCGLSMIGEQQKRDGN
jgi:hypothetical protein